MGLLNKSLDLFGNAMQKTSIVFQFRSALASYGLIILSDIFLFFYFTYQTIFHFSWWNILYVMNAFAGIFIIYSMLVSTYLSYLQIKAVNEMSELNILTTDNSFKDTKEVENNDG